MGVVVVVHLIRDAIQACYPFCKANVAVPKGLTLSCRAVHQHAGDLRRPVPLSPYTSNGLQVDGGVSAATAQACVNAGANVLTSGSFIFGDNNGNGATTDGIAATAAAVAELRGALGARWPQPAAV